MAKPSRSMDREILNLIEVLERKGLLKLSARKYRQPLHRAAPRYHPEELLKPEQAAAYLRVKYKTLAHWRLSGDGPRFVNIGSGIYYRFADLRDFVRSNTLSSTSEKRG